MVSSKNSEQEKIISIVSGELPEKSRHYISQ